MLAGVVHVLVWAHRMWGLCRGRLLAVPGAKGGKAGGAAAGRLDSLARPILIPRTHARVAYSALFSRPRFRSGVFPPKQIKKDPCGKPKAGKKKRGKGCCQNRAGNFRLPKHLVSFQFYYLSYTKNCKFYNAPPSLRVASTGHKYITSVK